MSDTFISGYCIRFNEETTIAGLFREKIAPNAFQKSLRDRPDVLALWSHDTARVLGRTTSRTLELKPDRIGVWFALTPDEKTPDGLTALGTVERQDVAGCSFGFYVTRETWDTGEDDELPLRIIEEATLIEVSLVSMPAYPTTSASVSGRSAVAEHNNKSAIKRIAYRKSLAERERMMKARGIL